MFPEKIQIEKSQDAPCVVFDNDQNSFEMSGRSFPADPDAFYQPLIKWLDDYKKNKPEKSMTFNFKIEYFNTASAKMLLDLFFKLEDIKEDGTDVKIIWHYLDDDEDMLEAGEEFDDIVEIDFEFEEYSEEDM